MRLAAGLTHEQIAERAKMRPAQVSNLERGLNVESRQFAALARALGFRSALELLRAEPADPKRDHLLRGWAVLGDDDRARVLRFLNRLLTGDRD